MSEVQLLRWYGKRVDVRKPTLHFNEFQEAFLELAPEYYYEDGKINHPAIITPDMLPDPELTAAVSRNQDGSSSDSGEETGSAEQHDTEGVGAGGPTISCKETHPRKRSRTKRASRPTKRQHDRIVLPVRTRPTNPDRKLRQREPVNYKQLNSKGNDSE